MNLYIPRSRSRTERLRQILYSTTYVIGPLPPSAGAEEPAQLKDGGMKQVTGSGQERSIADPICLRCVADATRQARGVRRETC